MSDDYVKHLSELNEYHKSRYNETVAEKYILVELLVDVINLHASFDKVVKNILQALGEQND